jgi:uncharacterized protein (DUF1501 family)
MSYKNTGKLDRRDLLKAAVGSFIAWHTPTVLSATDLQDNIKSVKNKPKLVWIILRGAMDSLHAILPLSDPDLMLHRKQFVSPLKSNAFDLGGGFALHPAFKELSYLYKQKQMIPVIAVESGANTRSHFYAQDILESGLPEVDAESGWLNRAAEVYQGESLAVAHTLPLGLRGTQMAKTWFPDSIQPARNNLYEQLQALYKDDHVLSERLAEGLRNRQLLVKMKKMKNKYSFPSLAASCATILADRDGPDCAMLEMSGWDTHQNQLSRLDRQFKELDEGIAALRENLADQWDKTVVLVTTEFGRTVAENGTKGTDHGTASAMFIAGGAVAGGRVQGRWPGLAKANLYEGRDLMPTSDTRQWIRAVLSQHWNLNAAQLDYVFPTIKTMDTQLIRPISKSDSAV